MKAEYKLLKAPYIQSGLPQTLSVTHAVYRQDNSFIGLNNEIILLLRKGPIGSRELPRSIKVTIDIEEVPDEED